MYNRIRKSVSRDKWILENHDFQVGKDHVETCYTIYLEVSLLSLTLYTITRNTRHTLLDLAVACVLSLFLAINKLTS